MTDTEPPLRVFDTSWREVWGRYAHIALLFALVFGALCTLFLVVESGLNLRAHGVSEAYIRTMAPRVAAALAVTALATAAGSLSHFGWDRRQLRRVQRQLTLEPGEQALGIVPAYVDPGHPLLARAGTFGEYLVLTDQRLLRLKYGFLGVRLRQSCLTTRDAVDAIVPRELAPDYSPLWAWVLSQLGLDHSLRFERAEGEPFEVLPEHPHFEALRNWLAEQGLPRPQPRT